ncbi:11108_t:CDS:1, partial [Racocetra persica]
MAFAQSWPTSPTGPTRRAYFYSALVDFRLFKLILCLFKNLP